MCCLLKLTKVMALLNFELAEKVETDHEVISYSFEYAMSYSCSHVMIMSQNLYTYTSV
jgi:hypothetical protein